MAKEFKAIIERIENFYDKFKIESFEDDEIDLINTIDSETGQIHDVIYDLMKNKITLAEFYETIDNSIDFIESDFEDSSLSKPFTDYCNATLTELERIKERIITHTNRMYTP